jgi:hypothetical protein
MILESDWNKINNLNFSDKYEYDPATDRIPSYVLAHLEENKNVWSPFPLCYTDSHGNRSFIYDTFKQELIEYIYRDRIGDNIEVGDESQYFLSTASYTWLVIMRTFNIKVIGRYNKIFKEDNKKLQLIYKNIAYSSRFQFARVFSIERREEIKGQIIVNVNSWLILKSRNRVMLPVGDPMTNIVNYNAIQTWVYKGETILEDLVMLFKFYQILDTKCWYCPLELDVMDGNKFEMDYYNPYREIQKRKKHFWQNEDDDNDNDNNNNNSNDNNNNNNNNNKSLAQNVVNEYNKKYFNSVHIEKKDLYQRAFGRNNENDNNNNIKNDEVIFN